MLINRITNSYAALVESNQDITFLLVTQTTLTRPVHLVSSPVFRCPLCYPFYSFFFLDLVPRCFLLSIEYYSTYTYCFLFQLSHEIEGRRHLVMCACVIFLFEWSKVSHWPPDKLRVELSANMLEGFCFIPSDIMSWKEKLVGMFFDIKCHCQINFCLVLCANSTTFHRRFYRRIC